MRTPDLPASAIQTAHRLVATGLQHRYGRVEVLRGVSFHVEPGEILCVVGPSGCGKSTLLRLVAGLERVQTGSIHIDGEVIAAPNCHVQPEQRDVGLVFQDFALFPHLSLLQNVAFGLASLPRSERQQIARGMLAQVGLGERADDPPHVLSGGQQQRVALARAMAPRPRLLLLDEPFSNLDVRLRHRMRVDTLRLLKESHTASILVTHDADEAMFMADRIALMQDGRIVQLGTPADLYQHPASPFAALFFGEMNRIDGISRNGRVETPLGSFGASGQPDGAPVQVLVRPESIQLFPVETGSATAQVMSRRMLGSTSLLSLQLVGGDHPGFELQAQVASSAACEEGAVLHLRVDPSGVFVFAASGR